MSRAISRPVIFPEKIAADASAISSESPAAYTFIPYSRAFCRSSSTGESPTAMSTVSTSNDLSVPAIGPELLVDRRGDHALDALVALGAEHRVRRPHGDAEASDLVLVDLVPAAPREGLDEPDHIDPRLQRVVRADEPHVAAAHDEEPLRGLHLIAVHERLEGARAVHAGQIAPGEGEALLARARTR